MLCFQMSAILKRKVSRYFDVSNFLLKKYSILYLQLYRYLVESVVCNSLMEARSSNNDQFIVLVHHLEFCLPFPVIKQLNAHFYMNQLYSAFNQC